MSSVASPTSAQEALGMLKSAMGYLAAADAAAMAAQTQALCLQVLEQAHSMGTAARSSILGAFTSGQGYSADADYSPRAWLINRTRVSKGAAVAYTAWVRRAAAHPEVAAALAAGEMSESYARTICTWTDKLPEDCREDADKILLRAARAGGDLRDLAGLVAEIYARSLPEDPGGNKDEKFEDRSVRLETTFQGAGVLTGDLTPGMRHGRRDGAGRPVRAGGGGGHPHAGPAVPRRRCRRPCAGWWRRTCCRSGPGSPSKPGCTSPSPT